MKRLSEITPDQTLAKILKGKIRVQYSEDSSREAKVYADGERPNKNLGEEFIEILWNGAATARTKPFGQYHGVLTLTLWVKTQSDGRVKRKIIRQILAQCESVINGASSEGFYFEADASNIMMPTTTNLESGYSTTAINIKWRES